MAKYASETEKESLEFLAMLTAGKVISELVGFDHYTGVSKEEKNRIRFCLRSYPNSHSLHSMRETTKKLKRAVEFAEYMATAAEGFQASCNALYEATESEDKHAIERAQEAHTDYFSALTSNIYEFRKRVPK